MVNLIIMKVILQIVLLLLTLIIIYSCKKESNTVNIPDNNFLKALIDLGVDKNGDNIISIDEATQVHYLEVYRLNISSLKGIEAFVNLDTLLCFDNQLTSLDISNNTSLTYFDCS